MTALLQDSWPSLRPRLLRHLAGRGLDRHSCEDVVQEVAARVLVRQEAFPSADDLYRWARRVADNLATDQFRRSRFSVPSDGVPDQSSHTDVGREVEGRLLLESVSDHLRDMAPMYRDAVLAALTGERAATSQEALAISKRRQRARERLRAALHGVAIFIGDRWRHPRVMDYLAGPTSPLIALAVVPALLGVVADAWAPSGGWHQQQQSPYERGRGLPTAGGPLPAQRAAASTGTPTLHDVRAGTARGPAAPVDQDQGGGPVDVRADTTIETDKRNGGDAYRAEPISVTVDLDDDGEPESGTAVAWDAWCAPAERGVVSVVACPILADT